jgi:hypothetical protein
LRIKKGEDWKLKIKNSKLKMGEGRGGDGG